MKNGFAVDGMAGMMDEEDGAMGGRKDGLMTSMDAGVEDFEEVEDSTTNVLDLVG